MNGIPAAVKAVVSVDKLMLVSCNSTYIHNSVRWRLKACGKTQKLFPHSSQEVRTPTRIQLGIEGANLSSEDPDF